MFDVELQLFSLCILNLNFEIESNYCWFMTNEGAMDLGFGRNANLKKQVQATNIVKRVED